MLTGNKASARKTFLIYGLIVALFVGQLALFPAVSSAAANLVQGKTITASSVGDVYVAANANDGNQGTYWESASNAFPQWLKIDLGTSSSVNQVVLKLPAAWEARTQTLAVQGSTNDSAYSNLAASASYTFNPSSGSNTVTINFTAANARYIKLNFTANTGWQAAQVSEIEVYGTNITPMALMKRKLPHYPVEPRQTPTMLRLYRLGICGRISRTRCNHSLYGYCCHCRQLQCFA